MIIATETVDLPVDGPTMRTFLARPRRPRATPGRRLLLRHLPAHRADAPDQPEARGLRVRRRRAEIYHRIEPPGTALDFEADRARALDDSTRIPTADFDADIRAALDFLEDHPAVAPGQLLAAGFCFGGHLAFRAALQPDVKATACFYATGIHNGKLGSDPADSLTGPARSGASS